MRDARRTIRFAGRNDAAKKSNSHFDVRVYGVGAVASHEETSLGFGTLLRSFRLARGVSQEELAARSGLSVQSVSALERGARRAPYRHTVNALADGLALSPDERERLARAAAQPRGPRTTKRGGASAGARFPAYGTAFIGREREYCEIAALVGRSRIVTIGGFGGVGKTRLAIEVGRDLSLTAARETFFVDFCAVRDPTQVVARIAAAFRFADTFAGTALEALTAALSHRDVMLVLDNCESVIDECARVVETLVRGCPRVHVLATSREPLQIDGEALYRLESLDRATAAIDLFVDRLVASGVEADAPDRGLVAQIVARLDGIPLAIELAAGLARTRSLPDILGALSSVDFLTIAERRSTVGHHRTMHAAIEWSYAALSDDERMDLRNGATGDDSFVGAGSANWADSDGSFLGAGIDNEIVPGMGSGTRSTAYSAIAAGNNNTITLTGGTAFVSSFIGAGAFNVVSAGQSVVTGGYGNRVSQGQSFVGAGNSNFVGNTYAFDGAGVGNRVTASRAFIGAGFENVAAGTDAAVPGGDGNVANGAASFAAGTGSHALHNGTFVWSDDATNATTLKSSGANQFLVRASGGVNLYSSAKLASGVRLAPGSGTWSSLSDRNAKTNIVPTDSHAILERVAALPISEWSYRTEDPHVRHLGPMAQDFYAAFGVGEDDRHITSLDEEGVALAAIKALEAQVRDLAARDAELENRIAALQAR